MIKVFPEPADIHQTLRVSKNPKGLLTYG